MPNVFIYDSPCSKEETEKMIINVINELPRGSYSNGIGYWKQEIKFFSYQKVKFKFYFDEKDDRCSVRITAKGEQVKDIRKTWCVFVNKYNEMYPNIDICLSGNTPYEISKVLKIGNEFQSQYFREPSFNDTVSARILWSDGLVTESEVKKKSELYQKIMVKMGY